MSTHFLNIKFRRKKQKNKIWDIIALLTKSCQNKRHGVHQNRAPPLNWSQSLVSISLDLSITSCSFPLHLKSSLQTHIPSLCLSRTASHFTSSNVFEICNKPTSEYLWGWLFNAPVHGEAGDDVRMMRSQVWNHPNQVNENKRDQRERER